MKVLFLGNSHTYYNDLPALFKNICKQCGRDVEVSMLAQPGVTYDWHLTNGTDLRFALIHGGYDYIVMQQAAQLNEPMITCCKADDLSPIFLTNQKNVIVDTIKPADLHENALLVRVYEAMGKQTVCAFKTHEKIQSVCETDMLEEDPQEVNLDHIHFGPFEIKTFILKM